MLLKVFKEKESLSLYDNVAMGLSKFEQKLFSHLVELRSEEKGKKGCHSSLS